MSKLLGLAAPLPVWQEGMRLADGRVRSIDMKENNDKKMSTPPVRGKLYPVRIASSEGHSDVMLSAIETAELIRKAQPDNWAFVNGTMTTVDQVSDIDWDSVQSVEIAGALVGGSNSAGLVPLIGGGWDEYRSF